MAQHNPNDSTMETKKHMTRETPNKYDAHQEEVVWISRMNQESAHLNFWHGILGSMGGLEADFLTSPHLLHLENQLWKVGAPNRKHMSGDLGGWRRKKKSRTPGPLSLHLNTLHECC